MRTTHRAIAADGTGLYYEVGGRPQGSGQTVVLCDGIGCDGFIWRYLQPALEERYTVIHPHYRGHGQSEYAADPDAYSIEHVVDDLRAVLDDAGASSAVLIGHSMGVQVALEEALTLPERVKGLGLLCGSFGRPLDTFHDHSMLKTVLPFARAMVERFNGAVQPVLERLAPTRLGWLIAQMTEVDGRMISQEDFLPYLEHLSRMDQRVFLRMLDYASRHTTEGRLDQVTQPVLIVGGERDRFTPYWVSEVLAEQLPDAELHMLRGGTHTAPLEHRELTELLLTQWLESLDERAHGTRPADPQRRASLSQSS